MSDWAAWAILIGAVLVMLTAGVATLLLVPDPFEQLGVFGGIIAAAAVVWWRWLR